MFKVIEDEPPDQIQNLARGRKTAWLRGIYRLWERPILSWRKGNGYYLAVSRSDGNFILHKRQIRI